MTRLSGVRRLWCGLAAAALAALLLAVGCRAAAPKGAPTPFAQVSGAPIQLPPPQTEGGVSVEEALRQRRSVRSYSDAPLTLAEAGQLLWAAQGITGAQGFRTAPSAGALYPLEVYLLAEHVQGLGPGAYRYRPESHDLLPIADGRKGSQLQAAALGQAAVGDAPAVLVLTAVYARTMGKYGERGIRYVHMEAGHAAQNIYLQAEALGLGTVTIGAFHDDQVKDVLGLPDNEEPLYLMPVGKW